MTTRSDYYEQRKASGLCVRCACASQDGRHVLCRKCRAKDRARKERRNAAARRAALKSYHQN